jgi:hypothetical protein
MYFVEYEYTEDEVLSLIQEAVHDSKNNELRELIIDPMIKVLETTKGREEYIKYGNEFLEANAEMLAKEFPTKPVTHPRHYVDNVFSIFGFTTTSFKEILKEILKQIKGRENGNFKTIVENPTNVIHTVVLYYSDMIINRKLRDSARQQLGLSMYRAMYTKFFKNKFVNESVMAYTYMNLNNTWSIVKSENMVNWIGTTVETAYGFYKTKLTVNISITTIAQFLSRLRTGFRQNVQHLANKYYANLDKGNLVGDDIDGTEDYLETNSYSQLRNNLMQRIKSGDAMYTQKGNLYTSVARLKNVKVDRLYELAKKVEYKDISKIIDIILYIFLVKEGNKVEDISSVKYISRISTLPTAVDRSIKGEPIILPLSKKYETDSSIIKAYICLIATYIMFNMNNVTT